MSTKYRVTMVVRDFLPTIWLFHCLPDTAWAVANWVRIAEQLGNIVELQKKVNKMKSLTPMVTLYTLFVRKFEVFPASSSHSVWTSYMYGP